MSNRREAIAKRLNLDFRGYSTESYCFYAGSVGRNTANKIVSDIDMIFVMPWNVYTKYNNYQSNGQSQFLQAVKNSIATTYPNTYLKGDGQVVVVNFSDGMKFEVVPAFKNDNGTYTYADSNNGGTWLKTNPKAEIKAILTAAGTLATIMPFLPETIVGSITALLAFTLSYFTFRYKDGILESKARECTQYASKVHHLRNLYSSLLADMKAETVSDSDAMLRRDQLEQVENELYSQSVPHTTQKAVEMATKALKVNQDSTTTDEEIQLILPEHLKI